MAFFLSSRRLALAASVFLAAAGAAAAQTMPNAYQAVHTPDSAKVYTYVEQMPRLPEDLRVAGVAKAIQARVAPGSGCGGKVFVSFVVGPSGVVKEAKIIKGANGGCNAAVLAAVNKLPRFSPGKQNNRPVAVVLTIPLEF